MFKRVSQIRSHFFKYSFRYCCQNSHKLQINENIKVKPIEKVLIANRGEIACRVIRTARKLGIQTVAVYSDADKNSMHVKLADSAYNIGPPPSQQSYLRGDRILEVAKRSGSQAIHPGYGFLSENVEFAEKCKTENVIFIGPPSSAIRDMGIKSTSKAIMSNAGVPIIEGYHGEDQSIEKLVQEAKRIGFPLMIKAVRGGGGKGMRIAHTEDEFLTALDSAKRESLKSFGDDNVLLEHYVTDPRHVEVQVFADMHGNAVHLFERDCSVQRRHQKIIEEAPAPGLSSEERSSLGNAAVRAAKAVGYVGAGTVEFILDRKTHAFHFMEMNTRLQVEHPITEMITGTDLVEWQLRVASGETLPKSQNEIKMSGHAFESRIYAEDPRGGFLPGAGPLLHLSPPEDGEDCRVETGVRQGDEVSVHYDPMIAKLVTWGKDRNEALSKMTHKLTQYQIVGLETNVNFLLTLCKNKAFQSADVHTAFITDNEKDLFPEQRILEDVIIETAIATVLKDELESSSKMRDFGIYVPPKGWRSNYELIRTLKYKFDGKGNDNQLFQRLSTFDIVINVTYNKEPKTFEVEIQGGSKKLVKGNLLNKNDQHILEIFINDNMKKCNVVFGEDAVYIFDENGKHVLEKEKPKYLSLLDKNIDSLLNDGSARSPMPGILDKMFVKAGDSVKKGDSLFVIIAMKMEYVVKAAKDGVIDTVAKYNIGDSVAKNIELVKFKQD